MSCQNLQQLLDQFKNAKDDCPKIEAWTFTIHPSVVDALLGGDRKLKRFILTIDTLRSTIYAKVKEFLESRTTNITSYYTGGWADFLCDIQMEQSQFDEFKEELKSVLRPEIEKIKGKGNVSEVITYFEVSKQIMMCGRPFKKIPLPSDEVIDEVVKDRVRFETVHKDYRSGEALELFENSEKKLRAYLSKLKAQGIIVCYDLIFDFSFGLGRDFVPMFLTSDQEGPINKLLDDSKAEPILIKPIRDWFKVRPIETSDVAEEEINYLFVNQYDLPGERTRWKQAIYEHSEIDVNLYNYPIESTLNESPISFSDLPEFVSKAKRYQRGTKDRKLFIGWPSHPLLQSPMEVALPFNGFGGHGVTLGDPDSGKTNIDLVVASEAAEYFKTVVILDASGGVESKVDTLPPGAVTKLQKRKLKPSDDLEMNQILADDGALYLLKPTKTDLPVVFAKLMRKIEALPDSTSGNELRKVVRLLLIEEAEDALGVVPDEIKKSVVLLRQLLNKAQRKGWCIWLSTQRPTSLGYDDKSAGEVLALLHNRIISRITKKNEIDLIVEAYRNERYPEKDLQYLSSTLAELPTGTAVCRAVEVQAGKERNLPLLKVKFRFLKRSEIPV